MEPTRAHGDALRAQLMSRGVSIFMLSPKRVFDLVPFDDVPR